MPPVVQPPGPITSLIVVVLFGMLASWTWALTGLSRRLPLLPARPVPRVPWNASGVLLAVFLWFGLQMLAGVVLMSLRSKGGELTLIELMATTSAINLALLFVLPLALKVISGARPAHFGLRRDQVVPDLLLGLVFGLLLAPIVYALQYAAIQVWAPIPHPIQEMLQKDRSLPVVLLAFSSAVILAPAAEELIFRVVFQGWLEKRSRSLASQPDVFDLLPAGAALPSPIGVGADPEVAVQDLSPDLPGPVGVEMIPPEKARRAGPWPIVISSLLFAGVHYPQWPAPLPLFALAIGLGLLYRRTGGLLAPFAMHATFNGISTLLMFAAFEMGVLPEEGPVPEAAVVASEAAWALESPLGNPNLLNPLGLGRFVLDPWVLDK